MSAFDTTPSIIRLVQSTFLRKTNDLTRLKLVGKSLFEQPERYAISRRQYVVRQQLMLDFIHSGIDEPALGTTKSSKNPSSDQVCWDLEDNFS
jgi:hypothetical protein